MCFEISRNDSTVFSGGQIMMSRMEYLSRYENEDDGDSLMFFHVYGINYLGWSNEKCQKLRN